MIEVEITLEDCINAYEKRDARVLLNDGMVTGWETYESNRVN